MRKLTCFAALAVAALARAADPNPERALIVTITWDKDQPAVETVDRREALVPLSRGFPQLCSRFLELRDKAGEDGNVYYAAPLTNLRSVKAAAADAEGTPTYRVVLPDLPDAHHLVLYRRDKDKGPQVVLERDL